MNTTLRSASLAFDAKLADHTTSLVRNCWYVAALAHELHEGVLERTLPGTGVLLYRKRDGTAVALRNRCPYRSFPLSRGTRRGDNAVCGYYRLEFRPDGSCAHIPSQKSVPDAVFTRSYPLIKRKPLIWIWMGDPDRADSAKLPGHAWLDSPDYALSSGYHPVKRIGNSGHRITRGTESWFNTPGFQVAFSTVEDLDGGVNGQTDCRAHIVHMPTPETARTMQYFWANTRNYKLDDSTLWKRSRKATAEVFQQDVDVLQAIEEVWGREEDDFREISVMGDRPGLMMRRIIARLAAAEA